MDGQTNRKIIGNKLQGSYGAPQPMRNTDFGNTCGIGNWKDASSGGSTRSAITSWILRAWKEKSS